MSDQSSSEASVLTERGVSRRKPLWAFILSFILPGLGQLYTDGPARAVKFYLLHLVAGAFLVLALGPLMLSFRFKGYVLIMVLHFGVSIVIASEAAWRAKAVRPLYRRSYDHWWVYLLIPIVYNVLFGLIPPEAITRHVSPRLSFRVFHLPSGSMMPTIEAGDLVLADPSERNDWRRGDLVVFRLPDSPQPVLKRIVGLPGETLEIRDGVAYIDGNRFAPEYWAEPVQGEWEPVVIPEGHYFFMGDNVNNSRDSRFVGTIPESDFVALVLFRIMGKEVGTDFSGR